MVTLSFHAKSFVRGVIDTGAEGSSHGDLVAGATYAVIGGTGIYRGASGQCDVFRNEDPNAFTTTVNCSFAVLD